MEGVDKPCDLVCEIIMHIERIRMELFTAKNLVNGKPIDADRKLQGIITRCDNLIKALASAKHELADEIKNGQE